jgi:hypothetical protein
MAAAFDSAHGRMVVFGGTTASASLSDEVFELEGAVWTGPFTPSTRPSARTAAAGAFHETDGRFFIYGGGDRNPVAPTYYDDLWAWDGGTHTWQEICSPCTGEPRMCARMVYFPPDDALILINGFQPLISEVAGTWRVDLGSGSAEMISPLPPMRDSMAAALDVARGCLISVGGNGDSCYGDCGETLEFWPP